MTPALPAGAVASAYTGRHADLFPLLPALARFYAAFDYRPDLLGTAANDNAKVPAVLDRRFDTDGAYCADLLKAWSAGKVQIASQEHRRVQFVLENGKLEPRTYTVPAGAITSIWGRQVIQEMGDTRKSKSEAALDAEARSTAWFCCVLNAEQHNSVPKTLRRREKAPPIDWTEWSAKVGGHVPLDQARASCGLPVRHNYPQRPGLPYCAPREIFSGLVAGRGSSSSGGDDSDEHAARRPDPEAFTASEAILEHALTEQFREAFPYHYATLATAANVGSMGDLVASNDNGTGKRRFRSAAEAWQEFLAS
ncbi:hypothetical protein [Devosia sediminis]|uniref:Uncharacterized protein n=1 Tax=Devosia sediminis TaxID=2798801 RepID=A0A934MK80_9HYPH|nr:hypothetical protein [Devosia sediminis]MBJ3783855.1 hypothetical protein [Devosia sediminis]